MSSGVKDTRKDVMVRSVLRLVPGPTRYILSLAWMSIFETAFPRCMPPRYYPAVSVDPAQDQPQREFLSAMQ